LFALSDSQKSSQQDAVINPQLTVTFGNKSGKHIVDVYISPTCPHCLEIISIIEDIILVNKNIKIVLHILPTNLKDIFVLKLLKKGKISFIEFVKRMQTAKSDAKIDKKVQKHISKLIKKKEISTETADIMLWILRLKYPLKQVKAAIPILEQGWEQSAIQVYKEAIKLIVQKTGSKAVDLPFITSHGEHWKDIKDAVRQAISEKPLEGGAQ
jgi:hypothetical protein